MAPTGAKTSLLLQSLLFLFFIALRLSSPAAAAVAEGEDGVSGYGYNLGAVNVDPSGSFLTAELALIRSSALYGPDLRNLRLTAR